jgi:hypothetical protein
MAPADEVIASAPARIEREVHIDQVLNGETREELPDEEVQQFVDMEEKFEAEAALKDLARELLDEETIPEADTLLWIDQCEVYSLCYGHYEAKQEGEWTGFSERDDFPSFRQEMLERLSEGVPCVECKTSAVRELADELEAHVDVEVTIVGGDES